MFNMQDAVVSVFAVAVLLLSIIFILKFKKFRARIAFKSTADPVQTIRSSATGTYKSFQFQEFPEFPTVSVSVVQETTSSQTSQANAHSAGRSISPKSVILPGRSISPKSVILPSPSKNKSIVVTHNTTNDVNSHTKTPNEQPKSDLPTEVKSTLPSFAKMVPKTSPVAVTEPAAATQAEVKPVAQKKKSTKKVPKALPSAGTEADAQSSQANSKVKKKSTKKKVPKTTPTAPDTQSQAPDAQPQTKKKAAKSAKPKKQAPKSSPATRTAPQSSPQPAPVMPARFRNPLLQDRYLNSAKNDNILARAKENDISNSLSSLGSIHDKETASLTSTREPSPVPYNFLSRFGNQNQSRFNNYDDDDDDGGIEFKPPDISADDYFPPGMDYGSMFSSTQIDEEFDA